MCRRITCSQCGKPSFAGCGMHVEQVLADVPRDRRCRCHEASNARGTAEAPTGQEPPRKSWLWPF
ncbi:MAG TPA: hypothetical protein VI299_13030 [Polyangiales bacterium]